VERGDPKYGKYKTFKGRARKETGMIFSFVAELRRKLH
jgi:hypothetical protein